MHGSMRRREETKPVGHAARLRRLPPTPTYPTSGHYTAERADRSDADALDLFRRYDAFNGLAVG
jgi:hypothetical protein